VSGIDGAPVTAAQIEATTTELDRELRRLHIARADRRAVVAEVRSDLETAAADGMSPSALIGPDIGAFARATAEARGQRPRPPHYLRVVIGGSLTAVGAAIVAYLLIVEVLIPLLIPLLSSWFDLGGHYPVAGPVVSFGAIALAAVLVALAALRLLLTGRSAVRQTMKRAALLVPLATAGGIAAAVAVGRSNDYSIGVIGMEAVILVLPLASALALARWYGVRDARVDDASASGTRAP
jgi:hypothetical protein